jgi:predicted transposase YbfD/YdcC
MSHRANIDSSYTQMEVNRGRLEIRTTQVSDQVHLVSGEWSELSQLICVHRICKSKERTSEEKAYFISSRKSNAFLYAEGIRLHWHIENTLHYVKDVTLKEDDSKIRTGSAPQNLSTMKNIALNIIRKNYSGSITQTIRMIANNIKELKNLIM